MSLSSRMASHHETDIAERLGHRKTRGSGNQPHDQMDGRGDRWAQVLAFANECKATRGESIRITKAMVEKARDQAGGERLLICGRFYLDDRLRNHTGFIALLEEDFFELVALAMENS